jgi:hypothetical protein
MREKALISLGLCCLIAKVCVTLVFKVVLLRRRTEYGIKFIPALRQPSTEWIN